MLRRQSLFTLFALALLPAAEARPPALFLSTGQLETVRERLDQEPFRARWNDLRSLASHDREHWSARPFRMADIDQIRFGWCEGTAAPDDTLRELTERLERDGHRIRNLALAGLLSGEDGYFEAARTGFLAWANSSTLLNLYDLGIDFDNATITGATTAYCSSRPWNMALDTIWQCYGLINFSDAYIILSRHGNRLDEEDDALLRGWLRELAAATNSGFHAWTRWADLHPSSGAYVRYRSDNHLGWALAGLAAAAAALEDPVIWNYVLDGGEWDDGRSGPYSNPSHIKDLLDRAVFADGEIYDQDVRAGEHKGFDYACFHLWALALVLQTAEVHRGETLWNFSGTDGGTLAMALDHYAPHVSLDQPLPDPLETTDPTFFRFLYEIVATKSWSNGELGSRLLAARDVDARTQTITQSIGPVALLLGELGDADFDFGRLGITRMPDGSILVELPPTAYGAMLFRSPDLSKWSEVCDFDPLTDTWIRIPAEEVRDGPAFFKAKR